MAGGNLESVRRSAARAVEAPDLRDDDRDDREPDHIIWPPDGPIVPLGISGLRLWLLDASKQLIDCDTRLGKNDMVLMFGGEEWLRQHFPQYRKIDTEKGDKPLFEVIGFDQKSSSSRLTTACQRKGIFSPAGRVFGRGAHSSHLPNAEEDRIVLHMGRRVLVAGQADKKLKPMGLIERPAGEVDGAFFPAYASLPPPAEQASTAKDAEQLMRVFGQWYWKEKIAAPLLILGMTAQMHICGALSWRSHAWLAAPTASGKSSLLKVIRALHGDWCLHVEDASEAAIRQVLGPDTLPVIIDEAEKDDNPERQRAVMNLAKKASSGAKIIRGGADHKGQEFTAQSCFLFASVLHGLVKGEERNRMAILEMMTVPENVEYDPPDLAHWRVIGRRMHRRMIEQWPRFARTLSEYKRAIWRQGFEGRWQDTFGTLLACADLMLFDLAPSQEEPAMTAQGFPDEEDLRSNRRDLWVRSILPLMVRGKSEARTDVERCIAYLMSRLMPGENGKAPEPIAHWIMQAMTPTDDGQLHTKARRRLQSYGLRLVNMQRDADKLDGEPPPSTASWENGYLAVAYGTCEPLAEIFKPSEWSQGGWLQSLGKIEGTRRAKVRFIAGMNADNALCVPLKAFRGED